MADDDDFLDIELHDNQFNLWFPLPYRVILLIIAGVWAWGLNLQYLHFLRIDVPALIKYNRHALEAPPLHGAVYKIAFIMTSIMLVNLIVFWKFTAMDPESVIKWESLPAMLFVAILGIFCWPLNQLSRSGRLRFLKNFRRIAIGGIDREMRFADILLADVFTSYAKVLGDLWICGCMFFTSISSTAKPERQCGGPIVLPLIIAAPYMIRLRQCLIEYFRLSGKPSSERRPHLLNSLKYASAFPVIIFSAMQKDTEKGSKGFTGEIALYRFWLLSALVNSFFSFYWDVARDWDLTLFNSTRNNPEYPMGLRQVLYFPAPGTYYAAIGLDFLLRLTWSLKLSPHLDKYGDLEGGIFILQFLEIFRRWLWIFFRVETEWVRSDHRHDDDIMLGDFPPYKSDEE